MKKTFLLFTVCLSISYINAQTSARDSIKQLLLNDKEDTSRVLHLADLSFEYSESKPDTAMTLALEALSLTRRIRFVKGEAISLNRVGNAYHSFGNYPKALEVWLQALTINEKIKNLDGIKRNYNNIGLIYIEQEDYHLALEYLLKAKELGEKIRDRKSLTSTLVNLGEVYQHFKMYDSARFYVQTSYEIANKINYSRMVGSAFNRLGSIHFEEGQNILALEYYRLSIPYSKKAKNDFKLSETFLDIAKLFEKISQNDSALFYASHSLKLAKEKGFIKLVRDAGRFLTSYYRSINKADSAFFYLDITKAANDSLFSQQKQRQLQNLGFDEKIRQQEMAAAELITKDERKRNLQYAAIVVGLITFIILFFVLSRSIIVNEKFIKFFGVVALLAVFEFINLYIHPYLDRITNHSPFIMLAILICIGALLVPLHHRMEKWITKIMVEKNRKIRLAAARKTIAKLEPTSVKTSVGKGEQTN